MSYCLNPDCSKPQNPSTGKFCQNCGSKLLLQERYRTLKVIGQGGFGRTFLAVDEYKPSKPSCVIKQFSYRGAGEQKAAELFEREAVRLDELGKHPQIPELFAHLTQDNRLYIVQEFIDGQNLAEELAETGTFEEEGICNLLIDLLPVLQFIHDGQVIHRDIKPENIIRRRSDNKFVLVDFGAAKYASDTVMGRTGTTIGSAGYAAPEQTFGKAVFASDIYNLGVTCLYLLTQMEPFDLYDATESAFMWRPLVKKSVSDKLGRILDKMTQNAVKERYRSAFEVLADLNSTSRKKRKVNPKINSGNFSLFSTLAEHSDTVLCLAISPDGKTLASGSGFWDKSIILWDLNAGIQKRTIYGHSDGVRAVAFSPDGQIASGSKDKIIYLWDVDTGKIKLAFTGNSSAILSVTFSPDGQNLVSGGAGNAIEIWNLKANWWNRAIGNNKRILRGHTDSVFSVAFSPDGEIFASGSGYWDKTIKLWNIRTGQKIRTLSGHADGIRCVAFSPDGQIIASGSSVPERSIKLWDVSSGKEIRTLYGHLNWVSGLAFSPDGGTLASSSGDNTIKLWNVSTGEEICTLEGHLNEVFCVVFSPDGQTIVSGSKDKTIKIWRCD